VDKTNAERQRRYIERLKQKADAPHSPAMILAALARLRPTHFPKVAIPQFARQLIAEAERLSPAVTNATEKFFSTVTNAPVRTTKSQTESHKEAFPTGDKLEIRKLQAELGRTRELLAKAEAKLATMPPGERDREVERLKTRNRTLTAENRHLSKWAHEEVLRIKRRWEIPAAVKRAVQKCLTADAPSKTERVEALTLLQDWINRDALAERKRPRENPR
jgi:hypothetical protein